MSLIKHASHLKDSAATTTNIPFCMLTFDMIHDSVYTGLHDTLLATTGATPLQNTAVQEQTLLTSHIGIKVLSESMVIV